MKIERERVRRLVRAELEKRLAGPRESGSHPAFLEIAIGPASAEDDQKPHPPCIIEPDRPCYNSGYCKRLGY